MTTKSDLVDAVAIALDHQYPKTVVKDVVDSAVSELGKFFVAGNKVQIAGLGIFEVKPTKARVGRNPLTGASVDIPAGKKLAFKPSADLKAKL